jgi:hypothetical protein
VFGLAQAGDAAGQPDQPAVLPASRGGGFAAFRDVQHGERGALGIGEHHLVGIGRNRVHGDVEGHRDRPGRPIRQ